METFVQLISSVGFPIACCIAMGYYVYKETDKNRQQISEIMDSHKSEISEINEKHKKDIEKMTEAINNNTAALIALEKKIS